MLYMKIKEMNLMYKENEEKKAMLLAIAENALHAREWLHKSSVQWDT